MTFLLGQPVLVTGATGLVGANLLERLLSDGAKVRAVSHQRAPLLLDKRIAYMQADLTNGENCRLAVEGIRYVFHCAARTSGAGTDSRTLRQALTNNLLIQIQLMQAADDAGVEKFLWLGSTIGYPATGDRPVTEDEMFIGEPFANYQISGTEKRIAESLCYLYGTQQPQRMTTLVLRPTNIYGPHDNFDPKYSRVVAALIRKVVERQHPLKVWGSGYEVRDLIHVSDVVEAMLLAIEKLSNYTVLNIGNGQGCSVQEILDVILDVDGFASAAVVFDPGQPKMIPVRRVDITKAQTVLGFLPCLSLRDGLKNTIDWYRNNRRLTVND